MSCCASANMVVETFIVWLSVEYFDVKPGDFTGAKISSLFTVEECIFKKRQALATH